MRLLVLAVLVAVSSAKLAPLFEHEKNIPGEYIVVLKPDADMDSFRDVFGKDVDIHFKRDYRKVFKGFEASMNKRSLLRIREHKDVEFVEEDMVVEKFDSAASWGLDRVDQRNLPLDGQANFPGGGNGVTAYVIDTGIFPENIYFENRASVGFDALDGDGIDCNGHGTHVAGTIGSNPYGIAREVALIGVRVLSCFGSGSTSGVVAGMDWVAENAAKPAVASMSLGGGRSEAMDSATQGMYNSGVTVSVAAGNDNNDACLYSPAGEPLAITVGATNLNDQRSRDVRASFSNYGQCVDIFAPGVEIISTWMGTDTTNTISGTSMACPHVSGALCVLLGNDKSLTPGQLTEKLLADATNGVIDDLPMVPASPNKLLYIGIDAAIKPRPNLRLKYSRDDKMMEQQSSFNVIK